MTVLSQPVYKVVLMSYAGRDILHKFTYFCDTIVDFHGLNPPTQAFSGCGRVSDFDGVEFWIGDEFCTNLFDDVRLNMILKK